jgi:hypothetical protein
VYLPGEPQRDWSDHLRRATDAAGYLYQIAGHLDLDAGISRVIMFQAFRWIMSAFTKGMRPAIFWMMRGVSRNPLRPRVVRSGLHMKSTFAWTFASTIFHAKFILRKAGMSIQEMIDFSVWICSEFYSRTFDLIEAAKKGHFSSDNQTWEDLNEHLTVLFMLSTYHQMKTKFYIYCYMAMDSTHFSEARLMRSIIDLDKIANERSGRQHLAEYTQHWILKLGEGPNRYTNAMFKVFRLNTLFRIETSAQPAKPLPIRVLRRAPHYVLFETEKLIAKSPFPMDLQASFLKYYQDTTDYLCESSPQSECTDDYYLWIASCSESILGLLDMVIKRFTRTHNSEQDPLLEFTGPIPDFAFGSDGCDCQRISDLVNQGLSSG